MSCYWITKHSRLHIKLCRSISETSTNIAKIRSEGKKKKNAPIIADDPVQQDTGRITNYLRSAEGREEIERGKAEKACARYESALAKIRQYVDDYNHPVRILVADNPKQYAVSRKVEALTDPVVHAKRERRERKVSLAVASVVTDFTPIISEVRALSELSVGKEWFSGRDIGFVEGSINAGLVFIPVVGSLLKQGKQAKRLFSRTVRLENSIAKKMKLAKKGLRVKPKTQRSLKQVEKKPYLRSKGIEKMGTNREKVSELLPGEGKVGTYRDLKKISKPGDNLTPHHMPQASYMKSEGVCSLDGVSMMMEQPMPGKGGRNRKTRTYGKKPGFGKSARQELAQDIKDVREIYKKEGLYNSKIKKSLKDVIDKNKDLHPDVFKKQ